MAERDPNLPQSTDPELQADLVRLLQVQGPLGLLNVLDVVIPTVSMGQVVPLDVDTRRPAFRSTDVFSNGLVVGGAAGAILADTGQLASGTYDVNLVMSSNDAGGPQQSIDIQHRNAANAANLAVWANLVDAPLNATLSLNYSFGYELGTNERLRAIQNLAAGATRVLVCVIFARRRT